MKAPWAPNPPRSCLGLRESAEAFYLAPDGSDYTISAYFWQGYYVHPALWLGQWLHIGKGYVLGNGRYTIGSVKSFTFVSTPLAPGWF